MYLGKNYVWVSVCARGEMKPMNYDDNLTCYYWDKQRFQK